MRFESIKEINKNAVLDYIKEAINNQKLGKELKPEKKGKKLLISKELKEVFKHNSELTEAFNNLTAYK